jgi:AP-3 complex subunit delta-1
VFVFGWFFFAFKFIVLESSFLCLILIFLFVYELKIFPCNLNDTFSDLQMGHTNNDSVKVPFSLPPNAQNEGQFAFLVEEITAPQKLRGTLTYILKSQDGSTQEKVDFRINLPVAAYLMAVPCKRFECEDNV